MAEKPEVCLIEPINRRSYSERTSRVIDAEVRKIVNDQYVYAKKLLIDNRDKLDRIAEAALERETLDHAELAALIEGRELPPRVRIVIPRYSDKKASAKEKRKTSIFQPRPREVPQGG